MNILVVGELAGAPSSCVSDSSFFFGSVAEVGRELVGAPESCSGVVCVGMASSPYALMTAAVVEELLGAFRTLICSWRRGALALLVLFQTLKHETMAKL